MFQKVNLWTLLENGSISFSGARQALLTLWGLLKACNLEGLLGLTSVILHYAQTFGKTETEESLRGDSMTYLDKSCKFLLTAIFTEMHASLYTSMKQVAAI